MLISNEYRALNFELHERNPNYGTSSDRWAVDVDELARERGAAVVLDYACGKGMLKQALLKQHRLALPYHILEYDPAIPGKEQKPPRADLVVCTDALEHIEPECLDAVLDDIAATARQGVFLTIATEPAHKTLADGRNAHLIVQPPEWWLPKLMQRWRFDSIRGLGPVFMFCGSTR